MYIYLFIYLLILAIWKGIISQLQSVSLFTTASNNWLLFTKNKTVPVPQNAGRRWPWTSFNISRL